MFWQALEGKDGPPPPPPKAKDGPLKHGRIIRSTKVDDQPLPPPGIPAANLLPKAAGILPNAVGRKPKAAMPGTKPPEKHLPLPSEAEVSAIVLFCFVGGGIGRL